jgi:hypothetical protein
MPSAGAEGHGVLPGPEGPATCSVEWVGFGENL